MVVESTIISHSPSRGVGVITALLPLVLFYKQGVGAARAILADQAGGAVWIGGGRMLEVKLATWINSGRGGRDGPWGRDGLCGEHWLAVRVGDFVLVFGCFGGWLSGKFSHELSRINTDFLFSYWDNEGIILAKIIGTKNL
jgi:hypothetical protein